MKTTNSVAVHSAIKQILDGITEAIKIAGDHGAPGGVLYAALMAHGCTLDQFNALMAALIKLGKVEKRGQCYFLKGGQS